MIEKIGIWAGSIIGGLIVAAAVIGWTGRVFGLM